MVERARDRDLCSLPESLNNFGHRPFRTSPGDTSRQAQRLGGGGSEIGFRFILAAEAFALLIDLGRPIERQGTVMPQQR
jgi:hypothetical protein